MAMKSVTELISVANDFVSMSEQRLTIFVNVMILLRNKFLHHKTLKHYCIAE